MLVGEQEGLDVLLVGIDEVVLQDNSQVNYLIKIISQSLQEGEVEGLMSEALRLRDGAPSRSGGGLRAWSL